MWPLIMAALGAAKENQKSRQHTAGEIAKAANKQYTGWVPQEANPYADGDPLGGAAQGYALGSQLENGLGSKAGTAALNGKVDAVNSGLDQMDQNDPIMSSGNYDDYMKNQANSPWNFGTKSRLSLYGG